jgi:CheY-like chemotaxis protein
MKKNKTPINILLVDDKPANLLALEAVLESLGLNLLTANSGEEALRHLMREDFALVLMDVRMPEMDGFETAASIRRRVTNHDMPIIFLTAAQDNETEKNRAYALGAIDFMLKPFVPSVLRTKVSILSVIFRKNEDSRELIEKLNHKIEILESQNMMLKEELNR